MVDYDKCCWKDNNCVNDGEWIKDDYVECKCNINNKSQSYLVECKSIGKIDSEYNYSLVWIVAVLLCCVPYITLKCCIKSTHYQEESPEESPEESWEEIQNN